MSPPNMHAINTTYPVLFFGAYPTDGVLDPLPLARSGVFSVAIFDNYQMCQMVQYCPKFFCPEFGNRLVDDKHNASLCSVQFVFKHV